MCQAEKRLVDLPDDFGLGSNAGNAVQPAMAAVVAKMQLRSMLTPWSMGTSTEDTATGDACGTYCTGGTYCTRGTHIA